jgi:hypothetical protein
MKLLEVSREVDLQTLTASYRQEKIWQMMVILSPESEEDL